MPKDPGDWFFAGLIMASILLVVLIFAGYMGWAL